MDEIPCPFFDRCAHADETCSEEKSHSCDVIANTTPPPAPEWDPDRPVTVTMPAKEWQNIIIWLNYAEDWNHARMTCARLFCKDKTMAGELAARYEANMIKAQERRKIIEEAIYGES